MAISVKMKFILLSGNLSRLDYLCQSLYVPVSERAVHRMMLDFIDIHENERDTKACWSMLAGFGDTIVSIVVLDVITYTGGKIYITLQTRKLSMEFVLYTTNELTHISNVFDATPNETHCMSELLQFVMDTAKMQRAVNDGCNFAGIFNINLHLKMQDLRRKYMQICLATTSSQRVPSQRVPSQRVPSQRVPC